MKKVTLSICLISLSVGTANALGLGQIDIKSYLNQPLKAVLPMNIKNVSSIDDIKISLANDDDYRKMSISRPFLLTSLRFKPEQLGKSEFAVHVTSSNTIREPFLELLLKVSWKSGSYIRLYTILLDPPKFGQAKNTEIVQTRVVSRLETQTGDVEVVVRDENLSMIAQNSALHDRYSVYQIMRGFYLQNPDAFIGENINVLRTGINLIVPDADRVAEVSRSEAINFVFSNAVDKRSSRNSNTESNRSKQQKTPKQKDNAAIKTDSSGLQSETNASITAKKINTEVDQASGQDVSALTSIADEFKKLTLVLEIQNEAIKNLNAQLSQKNDIIFKLSHRVEMLERSRELDVNVLGSTSTDQKQLSLFQSNQIITSKETSLSPVPQQIIKLDESVSIEGESALISWIKNIKTSITQIDILKSPMYLFSLVLAGLLMIIFGWKLMGKRSKPELGEELETEAEVKKDKDNSEIATAELQAIQSMFPSAEPEIQTLEEILKKIDILIAYHELDKAEEVCKGAMARFSDDPWLIIKEFEILASKKDVDLFFSRMSEEESKLSKQLPIAWNKVIKLGKTLEQDHKMVGSAG